MLLPEVVLVLAALVMLVVMMMLLLEMSLGGRGRGNANGGEAAERDSESHQKLHWFFSPIINTQPKVTDEKDKLSPPVFEPGAPYRG
jgi:hypothetical protein